jgi:hypothetical protein
MLKPHFLIGDYPPNSLSCRYFQLDGAKKFWQNPVKCGQMALNKEGTGI